MRTIRRAGGLAVAGLLLSSLVGGPAAAQEQVVTSPEAYAGAANAQALILTVAGSGVTAGLSKASGDSSAKAAAEGQGSLLLGQLVPLPVGTSKPSTATQTGEGKVVGPKSCAADPVPTQLSTLLTLGIACGTATAEVAGGKPNGLATGSVFDLDVTANTVLNQVPLSQLSPVLTPVLGGLDTINKTVAGLPVVGPAVGDLKVDDTLSELLKNLQSVKTLEVRLGSSQSQVVAVDGTVTALATAEGGIISILPVNLPLVDGTVVTKPLVEIIIGSAKAKAVYDRASGKATPTFDPSIVTIRINTPTTDQLGKVTGINFQEIQIDPALSPSQIPAAVPAAVVSKCPDAENEFCVLVGTPLETRIAVASGRIRTNGDGSVTAISDAVKINALKNLPAPLAGGLLLELARAEATVGGRPAVVETPRAALAPPPEIPAELPRTGGTPWMPIAGLAGLALFVVTRRTLVRSN